MVQNRERWQSQTEMRINEERERPRKIFRAGTEGR